MCPLCKAIVTDRICAQCGAELGYYLDDSGRRHYVAYFAFTYVNRDAEIGDGVEEWQQIYPHVLPDGRVGTFFRRTDYGNGEYEYGQFMSVEQFKRLMMFA